MFRRLLPSRLVGIAIGATALVTLPQAPLLFLINGVSLVVRSAPVLMP